MSNVKAPNATPEKTNREGFPVTDYQGLPSTLCKGCGHDSITRQITGAYFDMGVKPYQVVKASGIGCSSKTPAYFIHRGYGINAVHGRMPSVAQGAKVANTQLSILGVSGDGDTASIGIGQFVHLLRRNVDMVYVVENNGVYGLTKGQFSATADKGSTLKSGDVNQLEDIDLCALAITLGGTYVSRGFSSDAKQLSALLKGAISHQGTALVDAISPCVTFNNHEGSTKSISYVREHDIQLNEVGFVPFWEQPAVEAKPGEAVEVSLPDGSVLVLRSLNDQHDPRDRMAALQVLSEAAQRGEILTGLVFVDPDAPDFTALSKLSRTRSLASMGEADLRMPREALERFQDQYA